jgi:hypothetical protein
MASRENQGLQIALIVFVMMTMALAVTTYFFFHKSQAADLARVRLEAEKRQADDKERVVVKELNDLKDLVGFDATKPMEEVLKDYEQDMTTYGAGLDKRDQQKYRNVIRGLYNESTKKSIDAADLKIANTDLKNKLQAYEATKDGQIKQYKDGFDAAQADLASRTDQFSQDRAAFQDTTEQVNEARDKAQKELADVTETNRKTSDDMQKQLSTALARYAGAKNELDAVTKGEFTSPEGKITWVNQDSRSVWINLGKDDGLKKQISFSVFDYNENNVNKAAIKGKIEVVKLIDSHTAEARITQDSTKNPIMPGDVIYTPVWHPGHSDHFALAGFMDLDKDGRSDRARVRDLILFNGGVIDSEVDDKGAISGEMKITTRYLVLGDAPDEKMASPQVRDGYTKSYGQAESLGVERKSLQEFLNMVGYTPERGAGKDVRLSSGAAAAGKAGVAEAAPAEGEQPKASTPGTNDGSDAAAPATAPDGRPFRPRTVRFP